MASFLVVLKPSRVAGTVSKYGSCRSVSDDDERCVRIRAYLLTTFVLLVLFEQLPHNELRRYGSHSGGESSEVARSVEYTAFSELRPRSNGA